MPLMHVGESMEIEEMDFELMASLTYKQKAKNWKRQHVLIGVVSWGYGCAKVTP